MYLKTQKGWDKLKMLLQLLYPSRALRLFPPHFLLRDIVMEQLESCRKSNHRCALLLFDVRHYGEVKALYPAHVILQLDETIMEVFSETVRKFIADEHLLVVQRFFADDYVILLQEKNGHFDSYRLQQWTDLIRREAEKELQRRTAAFLDIPITFRTAYTWLDDKLDEPHEALQRALRDVQVQLRQSLPANLGNYRAEIQRIIEEETIHVLAQPIISLSTKEVEGWEILTRGPQDTPLAQPQQLFHFAHQAELLIPLELLVLQKALLEVERKQNKQPIFINMTVHSLGSRQFYQQAMRLMSRFSSISPAQIVFEITERHAIEDYPSFVQALSAFRRAGFRFAVDDTGAGYASLYMISQLMPEFIKIDRSIIQGIDQHDSKDWVLQALLLMAERIGSNVVAEGIETEAEAAVLMKKNVTYGQGFLFARPQLPFQAVHPIRTG
ncbi:MAG: EAL domain-containing protein [Brevibacillus sp.]|nr:EAL domain-containing protein [Brevibacillus sp.]